MTYKEIAEWLAITLTTGQDNIAGTSGNDSIFGVFQDEPVTDSFTLGDVINGGAGTDTLTITSDSDNNLSFSGKTITGIENLVIENAAEDLNSINFAGVAVNSITLDVGTNDEYIDVNMNGIAATSAVTVQNIAGDDNSYIDINFNSSSATSGSTTITLQDLDVNEMYTDIDASFSAATAYEFNLSVSNVDSNDNFNVNANIDLGAADVALSINVDVVNVVGEDVNFYLDFNTNGVASTAAIVNITDSDVNDLNINIDNNNNGTGVEDVLTLNLTSVNVDENESLDVDADDFEVVNINVEGDGVFFGTVEFSDNQGNDFALNIVANADMTIDGDLNLNSNVGSTTITISGSGNVDLGGVDMYNDGNDNTVMTIDASALTGDLTLADENGNGTVASIDFLTSGSGNDSITLAGFTTEVDTGDGDDLVDMNGFDYGNASASTLDGGAGTDTIAIVDGALLDAATAANISNFEVLDITGAGGIDTFDMSVESSLNAVVGMGSFADAVTIDKAAAGTTVSLTSDASWDSTVASLTYALKTATGTSDNFALSLTASDTDKKANTINGQLTVTAVTANAIESFSISSNATTTDGSNVSPFTLFTAKNYTNTISSLAGDAVKTVTLTGAANLTVTDVTATALTKVDASAMTGKLNITLDASANAGAVAVLGGSAADTVILTGNAAANNIIQGNGGADVITLAAAGTKETVRIASDTDAVVTMTDTTDPVVTPVVFDTVKGFDTIVNFTTAEDKIELASALGLAAGDARSALAGKGTIGGGTAASEADLAAAAQTLIGTGVDFFNDGAADRALASVYVDGDGVTILDGTMVLIDTDADGNFTNGIDQAIYLVGTSSLVITDFIFG